MGCICCERKGKFEAGEVREINEQRAAIEK
jgi:hypothetical protein